MRKKILVLGLIFGSCLLSSQSIAQERKIRESDHFWRKRVVNRISLIEKVNQPLVRHAASFYGGEEGKFTETNGIVVSLINGVKQGKYVAFHPDSWDEELDYTALRSRMMEFDQDVQGTDNFDESNNEFEADDFDYSDPFADSSVVREEDEWPFEDVEPASAEQVAMEENKIDYYPYEQVIHMVEDWIFDKGQSEMVQRIAFFEIIWVDPAGILPERVLARFKWEDVKPQLGNTQCYNRFNDAHARSMKEAMALRMFNSLVIHVGNEPVRTLHEAIRRKQELVEFEHHLWSY